MTELISAAQAYGFTVTEDHKINEMINQWANRFNSKIMIEASGDRKSAGGYHMEFDLKTPMPLDRKARDVFMKKLESAGYKIEIVVSDSYWIKFRVDWSAAGTQVVTK